MESVADSSLLRVMEKLPASFSEEGVWFADSARAWELAGLPPQPSTLEGFLALSDEERDAYSQARRGLMFGPHQLGGAVQYAQGWEKLFGFSGFAISLAVGSGDDNFDIFGTAYLEADFDAEDLRQRLLELGYREESVNGGIYYIIPDDRDLQTLMRRKAAVFAQMNRVFLDDGVLAAGPDTEPIVDVVGAAADHTPVLSDDPEFSRLAVSLRQPLSAALLPREAVLEPEGFARKLLVYEKPAEWGNLHQWEALGAGYSVIEGSPWWAISLFYPHPEAAEADAGEIIDRMNGYRPPSLARCTRICLNQGWLWLPSTPIPLTRLGSH
jgi:hypothetical protein